MQEEKKPNAFTGLMRRVNYRDLFFLMVGGHIGNGVDNLIGLFL